MYQSIKALCACSMYAQKFYIIEKPKTLADAFQNQISPERKLAIDLFCRFVNDDDFSPRKVHGERKIGAKQAPPHTKLASQPYLILQPSRELNVNRDCNPPIDRNLARSQIASYAFGSSLHIQISPRRQPIRARTIEILSQEQYSNISSPSSH